MTSRCRDCEIKKPSEELSRLWGTCSECTKQLLLKQAKQRAERAVDASWERNN